MLKHTYIKEILLLCIGICLGLTGCKENIPIAQGAVLPDLEIVFQTMIEGDDAGYSLGFTDAGGSTVIHLSLPVMRYGPPINPVWTSSGDMVVFNSMRAPGYFRAIVSDGQIFAYDQNEAFPVYSCIAPISNTHQIVFARYDGGGIPMNIPMSIHAVDLDTHKEITTYVQLDPVGGTVVDLETGTNSLHGQLLVFRRIVFHKQEILILNTGTGQETVLLSGKETEIMRFPAFSPDGASVAYTAEDGIYIIRTIKDAKPQKVTELSNSTASAKWPTAPSWSPDGQWLIYHRCMKDCASGKERIENFNIFKVNIVTGEEILLVEGGLNPHWRLQTN